VGYKIRHFRCVRSFAPASSERQKLLLRELGRLGLSTEYAQVVDSDRFFPQQRLPVSKLRNHVPCILAIISKLQY
jgi:hypothetical protein